MCDEVKGGHCNCIHRGHGGHGPPMTAALTFDPRAVAWGRAGSDREGSLYSWTPVLNPLLSHREGEPFPWIYGHKSGLSAVLAYSAQQVSSYTLFLCLSTLPGEIPFLALVLQHIPLPPPPSNHRSLSAKSTNAADRLTIEGGGANLAKIRAKTPRWLQSIETSLTGVQRLYRGRGTSGTGMSVLTRGNGGHRKMANYACRRQFGAVKTNEPSALKPAT